MSLVITPRLVMLEEEELYKNTFIHERVIYRRNDVGMSASKSFNNEDACTPS